MGAERWAGGRRREEVRTWCTGYWSPPPLPRPLASTTTCSSTTAHRTQHTRFSTSHSTHTHTHTHMHTHAHTGTYDRILASQQHTLFAWGGGGGGGGGGRLVAWREVCGWSGVGWVVRLVSGWFGWRVSVAGCIGRVSSTEGSVPFSQTTCAGATLPSSHDSLSDPPSTHNFRR